MMPRSTTMPMHAWRARKLLAAALLGALASACVSVPPPLQGEWSPLSPRDASTSSVGSAVCWGGRIEGFDAAEGTSNRASDAAPPVPRVAAQAIVLWPRRR